MKLDSQKLILSAFFLALAIALPQFFHLIFVTLGGAVLLPMHIPVLLAGFFVGKYRALIIGILAPILSFLITSMPPPPTIYFMVFELAAYGFFAGLFFEDIKLIKNSKINVYLSLVLAMICGRIVNFIVIYAFSIFMSLPKTPLLYATSAITTGLIGIAIQLVIIPPLVLAINNFNKNRA